MWRARRTKGRVVESAGTRTTDAFAPTLKLSTRGVDWVVADDPQTLCLGLERVVLRVQPTPVV